jgi:hypothetical protein
MTPTEKAQDLLDKMNVIHYRTLVGKNKDMKVPISMYDSQIKQCALIALDEIEKALIDYGRGDSLQLQNMDSEFRYWLKVREEIQKIKTN